MSDGQEAEHVVSYPPPSGGGQGRSSRSRIVLKYIGVTLGSFIVVLALLLLAFRFVLARAPEYRTQIQEWVSKRAHLHIEFAKLDARWRYYGPELVFDDAVVMSEDRSRSFVSAQRVSLAYDVWTAIRTFRLAAGRLTIEAPQLQVIRAEDGHFEVVGQQDLPDRDPNQPFEPDAMPTGRLRVVNARVTFRDLKAHRGPWVVPGVSFELQRAGSAMDIEGDADLPQGLGKSLRFEAHTAGKLAEAQALDWRFKIVARELNLAGWAGLGPADSLAPTAGLGGFTLTGSFQGTYVNDLAAQVRFNNVILTTPVWSMPLPAEGQLQIKNDSDDAQDEAKQSSHTAEAVVDSDTTALQAAIANTAPPLRVPYSTIAFDLVLSRHAAQRSTDSPEVWALQIKDLELSRESHPWRDANINVLVKRKLTPDDSTKGDLNVTAQATRLALGNLWPLLAYARESKVLAQLRALEAEGAIDTLKLQYDRADDVATYAVSATLDQVSFKAINKVPGFEHLSGVLSAGNQAGHIELNVRNGVVLLPTIFRGPLPVDRITGSINWQHEDNGWRINANNIAVDNVDGHATGQVDVMVPADGSSIMVDAQANGVDLQARAAPRYMPAGHMSANTLAWLDRAFTGGTVPQASFEMHGPMRAFPFRHDEGLFLIKAHIDDLTLDYQPGWVPATKLVIDAEFRNEGMSAVITNAEVAGLHVQSASGKFIDFKQSELLLEAIVDGDLKEALPYVQQSPVGPVIGNVFMALSGSGHLHSNVDMRLPFKEIDKRRMTIDNVVTDATVSLKGLTQSATHVTGKFLVQDHTVKSLSLQAEFLRGPLSVSGGADDRYTGPGAGVTFTAQGRAMGAELAELLYLPTSVPMKGTMNWQLNGKMPRHPRDTPSQLFATVESDGKGLSLSLPEPIGKRAEEARALKFDIETHVDGDDVDSLLIRGAFGKGRALAKVVHHDESWELDRAGLRVDGIAAALPAHTGLRIEGNIERFALDEWLKIKSDRPGGGRPLSDYLRAANVHIGEFGLYGYVWNDVRGILQATDNKWRIDVVGDTIAGQLFVPYSFETAPLELNLSKLDIGKRSVASHEVAQADPRDFPALHGRIDALQLYGRAAGVTRIALDREPRGLRLTLFEIRGDSFTANATGKWLVDNNPTVAATTSMIASTMTASKMIASTTALTLDVASTDVRATLHAFDFHEYLTGKQGNLHASLNWPGAIDENVLARASGLVRAELADGQVLEVEPGAGRLLGLMNVSALQRRLSLDFSDVTEKGFSFDSAHGDFEFRDGESYTNNLLIRGPAGEAGMVGRIGFVKKDLDLTLVKTGDIGGGLSVASTVVGGPVLGAAVLAFTRLFKEPLKGVSRSYFSIQGAWDKYTMERIDKEEAKQNTSEAEAAVNESRKENAQDDPVTPVQ